MTDLAIDPFAGLPADIPQEAARDAIAAIVKGNGVSVDAANTALAAKGFAPLNANSAEYHEAQKDRLLNDSGFTSRYQQGDPEAIARLYQADLKIAAASGKLTDRPMSATDAAYEPLRQTVAQNIPGADSVTYATELANLAASIGMPAANATAMAEQHFDAIRHTANMTPDEKASWAEGQAGVLHSLLGEDANRQIADASKALSEKAGRKIDLASIAKSNGVALAVTLLFQAQTIKGVR